MGTGVGEAMLIGAATGGGMSAITGGDPLKGAMLGAATAGIGDKVAGLQAANEGTKVAQGAQAAQGASEGVKAATNTQLALQNAGMNPAQIAAQTQGSTLGSTLGTTATPASNPMFPKIAEMSKSAYFAPGLGAMGATVGGALNPAMPGKPKYSGPLSRFKYDPNKYKRANMATGGLADTAVAKRMMSSGGLGSYSDGGRLLKRPKDGDGMTDNIPAKIGDKQPARLADGEFVIPADVVSGIGNGSTDAGARKLYAMLDRVREARTGTKKQGREIKAEKYLPT